MEAFQQRVVDEKRDLEDKYSRLMVFKAGGIFGKLPDAERSRLDRQAKIMRLYADVLGERIAAFGIPSGPP